MYKQLGDMICCHNYLTIIKVTKDNIKNAPADFNMFFIT